MELEEYYLDVTEMIKKQKELDSYIAKNHDIYQKLSPIDINKNLKLAILVELSEFSNTTRCFKMWSNKGMMEKEVMLEEYIDIIHFLLGFTYSLGVDSISFSYKKDTNFHLTDIILNCYNEIIRLDEGNTDIRNVINIWNALLLIASKLHFTPQELIDSYNKKNAINHQRQDNNY